MRRALFRPALSISITSEEGEDTDGEERRPVNGAALCGGCGGQPAASPGPGALVQPEQHNVAPAAGGRGGGTERESRVLYRGNLRRLVRQETPDASYRPPETQLQEGKPFSML